MLQQAGQRLEAIPVPLLSFLLQVPGYVGAKPADALPAVVDRSREYTGRYRPVNGPSAHGQQARHVADTDSRSTGASSGGLTGTWAVARIVIGRTSIWSGAGVALTTLPSPLC